MNLDSPRLQLAAASGISAGSYFLMSKYVAVHAGVDGIAVLGVVASASNLFALLADFNVGGEMTKRIALLKAEEREADESQIVSAGFSITLIGSVVLLLLCVSLSTVLGDLFGVSYDLVLLGAACGTATIFSKQFFNVLSGLRRTFLLAFTGTARALVVTVVVITTMHFTSVGVVRAYTAAMTAGLATTALLSSFGFKFRLNKLNFANWSSLTRVGMINILTSVASQGVWFFLPSLIWITSGSLIAGYFSAVWLIAGALQQLWSSVLSHEFFPRIAVTDPDSVTRAIRGELRFHIAMTVIPSLIIVVFQKPLLAFLFTSDIGQASSLLPWVLIGVICRVVSNILGLVLYARKSPIHLLALEATSGFLLVSSIVIGPNLNSSTSTPGVAFAVSQMLAGLIALFMANRYLGFPKTASLGGTVLAYSVLVLAVALISERTLFIGVLLACPVIISEIVSLFHHARRSRPSGQSSAELLTHLNTTATNEQSELE
jgi:O-antigen/teichoic acid export membrane protein